MVFHGVRILFQGGGLAWHFGNLLLHKFLAGINW